MLNSFTTPCENESAVTSFAGRQKMHNLSQQRPQLSTPQVSRRALLAAGSLLALCLTGCGGGGSSGNSSANPTPIARENTGVVTTLAGDTSSGFTDGSGTAALFSTPQGVAVDASGNVYVADRLNNSIRKISVAGGVTTLAGSATSGSADGNGAAASFKDPYGVAVDASGNVYVADSSNHLIRKITPAGGVTTLAGSTTPGSRDGTGTAAAFNFPRGIAVDASGNVYVADTNNHTIRKVTPAGVVTTLAGIAQSRGRRDSDGEFAGLLDTPWGVAVDASGNVFVADTVNHLIRKVTPAGVVTTLAGTAEVAGSNNATGTLASFNAPRGVTADASGNIYVADTGNHLIRKITKDGVVTTMAGTAGATGSTNATGTSALFSSPSGVTVDANNNVYVADTGNNMIRKIN
ncbi:NHL repeat-containing protein [Rhodoferax aquaticus]|nr:NHL repeat-containing protein [Rhodoferax aquaticus]